MLRGTLIVSLLTLLSRVLGFVRDCLLARLFGTSQLADIFFVAYRIPNLLRSFVAEGAMTSAFVPVFSDELKHGHKQANFALQSISAFLLTITLLISLCGIIFSSLIVTLFAPGFDEGAKALCTSLTQVMFPYIICISFVAMLNGALNSMEIYGVAAMSQVIMNLVLIAGSIFAFAFDMRSALFILSVTVIIGGLIQVLYQLPTLRRAKLTIIPNAHLFSMCVRKLIKLMLPALIGATVYQISIFINTLLASLISPGAISHLYYADRIAQLPIGVFSIALASVLLPTLSRAKSNQDRDGFDRNLVDALRYTSFILLPISFFLFYFSEPLMRLLFEGGQFTEESSRQSAACLRSYCLGLWAISCYSMLARAFMASKDTKTPTKVGLITLIVNIILALVLMGPIQSESNGPLLQLVAALRSFSGNINLGASGLALASSGSNLFSFLLLYSMHRRKSAHTPFKPFIISSLKACIACLACFVAFKSSPPPFTRVFESIESDKLRLIFDLGLNTILGFVIFCLSAYLLKVQEFQELLTKITKALKKT